MLILNTPEHERPLPNVNAIPFTPDRHVAEIRTLEPSVWRINRLSQEGRFAEFFAVSQSRRGLKEFVNGTDVYISYSPSKDGVLGVLDLNDMPQDIVLTGKAIQMADRDPLILDALLIHALSHLNGETGEHPDSYFHYEPVLRQGYTTLPKDLRVTPRDYRLQPIWADVARDLCGQCSQSLI